MTIDILIIFFKSLGEKERGREKESERERERDGGRGDITLTGRDSTYESGGHTNIQSLTHRQKKRLILALRYCAIQCP